MKRIMTMITKIEDDDFVAIAKRSPEWKVAIDREPVAMTQEKPRADRIAVLTDANDRAIFHLHIESMARMRHVMNCRLDWILFAHLIF
jgi:hypothetical protein